MTTPLPVEEVAPHASSSGADSEATASSHVRTLPLVAAEVDGDDASPGADARVLSRALAELERRRAAEAAARRLLADQELSRRLAEELAADRLQAELLRKLAEAEAALQEQAAVDRARRETQRRLGQQLLAELWEWSREHGALKRTEQDYTELCRQHDEVVAQLLQAEMDLEDARQQKEQPQPLEAPPLPMETESNQPTGDAGTATAATLEQEPTATEQNEMEHKTAIAASFSTSSSRLRPPSPLQPPPPLSPITQALAMEAAEAVATATEPETPTSPPQSSILPSDASAISSVQEVKPEQGVAAQTSVATHTSLEQPAKLDELDNKFLMVIFSYLDALDILNMAQTNVSMYSRIDSMFGMGDENDSTIASPGGTSNVAMAVPNADNRNSSTLTAPTTSVTCHSSSLTFTQQPSTIAAVPPATATIVDILVASTPSAPASSPKHTVSKSIDKPATSAATTTTSTTATGGAASFATPPRDERPPAAAAAVQSTGSFDGPRNLFASLLQPRKSPGGSTSSGTGGGAKSSSVMNAALASSMGAKLSDAELNAIIAMTKRLKEKEALADDLQRRFVEASTRLEASEAVREFLVGRCREAEQALAALQEQDVKVAQQIASDQEVIGFLDGRVQELEAELERRQVLLEQARARAQRLEEQAQQKSMIAGDMLQYEREKLQESEREWRATKKLLIKEVKHCRAQIVSLQAERDGYREQNERLKTAVLNPSAAAASLSYAMSSKGHC